MKKGLIESETVKVIIMVVAMLILIAIVVLVRDQLIEGVKSFFSSWR